MEKLMEQEALMEQQDQKVQDKHSFQLGSWSWCQKPQLRVRNWSCLERLCKFLWRELGWWWELG